MIGPHCDQCPTRCTTVDELYHAVKAMLCLHPNSSVLGRFLRGDFVRFLRRSSSLLVTVAPPIVYRVELKH